MSNTHIVILAGGLGKRMGSENPKVLVELKGKPLIKHLLESVEKTAVHTPVIVVGKKREMVIDALGDAYSYAIQEQQLGTGHAVMSAKEVLQDIAENVIVLYGDQPLISADTISRLIEAHEKSGGVLTMMTTDVDFQEWRAGFYDFSRVIRDADGRILKTIEKEDLTDQERATITEVNPACFCFDATWLWDALSRLKNDNVQGEYYLTDLAKMAFEENHTIASIQVDPKEMLGANTPEQLAILEQILDGEI